MASCMEKTAAWALEIPVVWDTRSRLPALDKKYRKVVGLFAWSLPPSSSLTQFENYQTYPTLSHFLSLVKRMITSLGCIWYPSSLNDKFLPSKVTLIRYLQEREESKENINAWKPNPKWEPASPLQLTSGGQEHSANNGKSKRKGVRKTGQLLQEWGQPGKAG